MATKPIKGSDIIESGALTATIEDAKKLLLVLDQMDKELLKVATSSKKAAQGFKATNNNDIKTAVAEEKKLTTALLDQERIKRSKMQTEKSLISLTKQRIAETKREETAERNKNSAYLKSSRLLSKMVRDYQDLAVQKKANTREARKLKREITALDTSLKKIDSSVGRNQRSVGKYQNALKGLSARFIGTTAVAYGLFRVLGNSFRTIADFQQGTANLASVLGKTRGEIKELTEDAKRLGASTVFTAKQVTKLQTAFAKLGFNETQILDATEATLQLAAATGSDLEQAATVAAQTLNGFGLGAEETQRVVDVMAKSFSTSALDMEKFSVGMANASTAAKLANFSVERTSAALGLLVDRGIDASKAGTDLRKIFSSLAKSGLTYEQAMEKINNSTNKTKTAIKLFGERAFSAGVILSESNDKLNEMDEALQNAGGSAEEMANTQLDTLSGATTRLSSAWEGFILSLEDGDGVIARVLRGAIELTTEFLNKLQSLTMAAGQLANKRLNENEQLGADRVARISKDILELNQKSNKELQEIANSDEKRANSAKNLLLFRKEGFSTLESELLSNASLQEQAEEALKTLKEEEDSRAKIKVFQGEFLEGHRQSLNIEERAARSREQGEQQAAKELNAIRLRRSSLEDIEQIIFNSVDIEISRGVAGKIVVQQAKDELQRRKELKLTAEETTEEAKKQAGHASKEEKTLTGLAALKRELNELEKKRSDYLVANNGEIDAEYTSMTRQTRELEIQLEIYKDILDKGDKIQRVEGRKAGDINAGDPLGLDKDATLQSAKDGVKAKDRVLTPEELEQRNSQLKTIAQNFTDVTVQLSEKRLAALDREAEAQRRLYDESKAREQEIIAQRSASDSSREKSLAFEKEAQAQALKEQEKIAKKRARIELFNSGLNLLNNYVQEGKGVGDVVGDMGTLVSALDSLTPAFWEGTDTTVGDSLGVKYSSGRDGILARVDASEMILNKKKVDTLSGYGVRTTDDIVNRVKMGSMFKAPNTTIADKIINVNNQELISKLDSTNSLLESIASKPNTQLGIEELGTVIKLTEKITRGNKVTTTTTHKRAGR